MLLLSLAIFLTYVRAFFPFVSKTDDDFTYVSDSDDDSTSESTSNRESVARERAARSAAAAHRHFAAKRRTAGGRGGVERRLNLGESAEIKKMLEQVSVCLIAKNYFFDWKFIVVSSH